ncbi:MAG: hypothetical protein RLZ63_597 [Pseudomonadota bacterium]|jgi:hypothetical protein
MERRHFAISLEQAAQDSPALARLTERVRVSSDCLVAIRPMLPPALRTLVQAGPFDEGVWHLLTPSNAAAAKIRQFVPAIVARLQDKGLPVQEVRIKVNPNAQASR